VSDDTDHDPFNEPQAAHPRARELMTEEFFWDCADEEAPFGSDEGHDAYYQFRDWRRRNRKKKLTACLARIMQGEGLNGYNDELCSDAAIERDLEDPDDAFLAYAYDMFTLDTTVIATALGQLLDEGRIDAEAKPYARAAIKRQLHPKVATSKHRKKIRLAVQRVVDAG
jgi:uncharacterized protein YfeS